MSSLLKYLMIIYFATTRLPAHYILFRYRYPRLRMNISLIMWTSWQSFGREGGGGGVYWMEVPKLLTSEQRWGYNVKYQSWNFQKKITPGTLKLHFLAQLGITAMKLLKYGWYHHDVMQFSSLGLLKPRKGEHMY